MPKWEKLDCLKLVKIEFEYLTVNEKHEGIENR